MTTRKATTRRSLTLLLVLALATAVLPYCAYEQMESYRRSAVDSAVQWRECRRLAEQIKTLKDKPLQATASLQSKVQLAHAVEEAAKMAGISVDRIIRIDARPPRQIEKTLYKEQPTYVELQGVTLHQIIQFLYSITKNGQGMEILDLRLHAPRVERAAGAGGESWDVEVTLTYLIFTS